MGIDFSHCDASWSYSGFNSFRHKLAKQIKVNLDDMYGFGGFVSWDKVKDPIKPLLDHSDCDGELTPEECTMVVPRLKELITDWPDDYDKRNALELIEGMELCIKNGENLEFI